MGVRLGAPGIPRPGAVGPGRTSGWLDLAQRCGPGRWWDGLRWYVRGMLGGSAYDGYLAWHARHGDGDPMSERAYWRHRTAHQEAHPEGRCC